jgi:hypothetical protein
MMESDFLASDGIVRKFDLDSVHEIVRGTSGLYPKWNSIIVFDPSSKAFIEVRSSPPDIRGNRDDEAVEVGASYLRAHYGLSEEQLVNAMTNPTDWRLINLR